MDGVKSLNPVTACWTNGSPVLFEYFQDNGFMLFKIKRGRAM